MSNSNRPKYTKPLILDHNNYHHAVSSQQWQPTNVTSSVIDFRLLGQKDIRRFDASKQHINNPEMGPAVAQQFVDMYCTPLMRIDYDKDGKPIYHYIGGQQVDWFVQRHEWEIK